MRDHIVLVVGWTQSENNFTPNYMEVFLDIQLLEINLNLCPI
jgi:hypothetical protein